MSGTVFSSAEQLIERVASSRWTPIAVNVLAMVLLTYSLAQWSWRLLDRDRVPVMDESRTAPVTTTRATDLQTLLAANLFGQAGQGNALPLTSLNLVLTGVMVRGTNGYALIRIEGGEETSVGVGQEILAGARLHAVHPDRAVLERGGVLENLMLKDADALPEGSIVTPGARGDADAVRQQGNQYTVSREAITQQMQRPEFLSQALMVPHAGGGFLVRQVQRGSMYEKLGVRVGDVIRGINGQPINNMDEVMKVYQQLGGINQAGSITLEVTRAGRTEVLQYNLE